MAELAALRRIHFVMAYQAIGHSQKSRCGLAIRVLDTVMTSQAGIAGAQLRPEAARRRQVRSLIDGRDDDRADVAQLQVRFVTERFQLDRVALRRAPRSAYQRAAN